MLSKESPLQILRTKSPIPFPKWMEQVETLSLKAMPTPSPLAEIESTFPHLAHKPLLDIISSPSTPLPPLRIGAVFSGGQAPGGHNVLCGLFDALEQTKGTLIGFLGGPSGLIDGRYQELSKENLSSYRNMGGFDLLGSGRTKIETKEQQQKALSLCLQLHLDGLVIIGGDDSNTNAAVLAEFFEQNSCTTKVIGVPKTIDGDLQNAFVPISFGFDTASKIYSELISNLAKDALSDRKYYHIIKLMGRTASHVTFFKKSSLFPT
jgi:pyrophosphate--fructose-6-phosphate 1-phosphotransferase